MALIDSLDGNSYVTVKQAMLAVPNIKYTGDEKKYYAKNALIISGHFTVSNQESYKDTEFVCNKDISLKTVSFRAVTINLEFEVTAGLGMGDLTSYQLKITNTRSKNDLLRPGILYSCKDSHLIPCTTDSDFDFDIININGGAVTVGVKELNVMGNLYNQELDKKTINLNKISNCPDLVPVLVTLEKITPPVITVKSVILNLNFVLPLDASVDEITDYVLEVTASNYNLLKVGSLFACKESKSIPCKSNTEFSYIIKNTKGLTNFAVKELNVNLDTYTESPDKFNINLNKISNCPDVVPASVVLERIVSNNIPLILKFTSDNLSLNLNVIYLRIEEINVGKINGYDVGDVFYCNQIHELNCEKGTIFLIGIYNNRGNFIDNFDSYVNNKIMEQEFYIKIPEDVNKATLTINFKNEF